MSTPRPEPDPPCPARRAPDDAGIARRCAWRTSILVGFAVVGAKPVGPTLTTLFALAGALSVFLAIARREALLGAVLTHWDEAAFYGLLSRALLLLDLSAGSARSLAP